MKKRQSGIRLLSALFSASLLFGSLTAFPAAADERQITQLSDLSGYASVTDAVSCTPEGLPGYRGGKLASSIAGLYGLVTTTVQQTNPSQYVSYLKSLEEDGWKQYSNNIIGDDSLFATYTKGTGSAYVYYIGAKKTAYIAVSPTQNLENRKQENTYEKITTPQLTQIKMLSKEVVEGMSYFIRLSDGRFIVVDGGWNEANDYEAKKLYERLSAQNELDTVTIAAWFVTHPHGDHLGTINDFLRVYAGKVKIEEMIFHFPTDEIYAKSNEAYLVTDMSSARVQTFFINLKKYWPDLKIVTSHTGQKYYIADAEIEILHTLEDYFPRTIDQNGDFSINSISNLFTVTIAGQRILFTGDLDPTGSADAVKMWGSYLKSDIVQMNHHGLTGATVDFYKAVSPTVAMMPAAMPHYEASYGQEASRYLLDGKCPTLKEIIVSGFLERTLALPYESDSDVLIPNIPKKTYTYDEPKRNSAEVPEPYMDLAFDGDDVTDAAGNTEMTMRGGSIDVNEVVYRDKTYRINSYRAEESGEYVDVKLRDIGSADELGDFLLSGCTFEMFVALDKRPNSTTGFLTSCYSGGVSLYLRGAGGLGFQIGNAVGDGRFPGSGYSYVTNDTTTYRIFDEGNVTHVTGTYDPTDNTLNLYLNGMRIYKTDYGTKKFNLGNAAFDRLGIGLNVSYTSESLAAQTPYTVIRSRVYDTCLTDEQVAAEYWNCIDLLLATEPAPETAAPETAAPETAVPGTEAVGTGEPTETKAGDEKPAEEKGLPKAVLYIGGAVLLAAVFAAGVIFGGRKKKN
ncbi:MAG: MBL fold metallo-hydrolase [Lachnospiraceae bacterium]|nr:MBL fold metallo-hydrolase [Lachnospiraceae bacterium]